MPEVFQNILISLGTSMVVGFFTFAFGMKSGKNQSDRASAQAIYTKLLNEFEAIEDSLDTRPKVWGDYPQRHGLHEIVSITPLKEIRETGEYVYVSDRQLQDLEGLERDALAYGWRALELVEKIPATLDGAPDLFEIPGEYRESSYYGKPSAYVMKGEGGQHGFRYSSIYDFLNKHELACQLEEGIELVFTDGRSPEHVRVAILPGLLKVSPAEFACAVHERLIADRESGALCEEKAALKERLNEQVQLLRKQARDPFPFWKTFGAALRDIGKAN